MSETELDKPPKLPENPSRLARLGLSRRVAWVLVAIALATAVLFAGTRYFGGGGPSAPSARPAVGGPFQLTDHEGRRVTDADFRGRLMLVFFGFTYCPDVCPTALTHAAQAIERLGPDAEKVVPIFITVDPERDSPEQLKEYVRHFHPRLIGLTGTSGEIAAAAKAYRVYFAKARAQGAPGAQAPNTKDPAASSAPGLLVGRPAPPGDDYSMDHTSITYLMGRDGKFLAHFSHGTEPEVIAQRIRAFF